MTSFIVFSKKETFVSCITGTTNSLTIIYSNTKQPNAQAILCKAYQGLNGPERGYSASYDRVGANIK